MLPLDAISANLAVVDAHIRNEAQDPASVAALYTEDAVLEMPTRGLRFASHAAVLGNCLRMFAAMSEIEIEPVDRFATADRVVDECRVRCRLTGDGMAGAPVPVGAGVELRLLHVIHMRGGRIGREVVYEGWRRID